MAIKLKNGAVLGLFLAALLLQSQAAYSQSSIIPTVGTEWYYSLGYDFDERPDPGHYSIMKSETFNMDGRSGVKFIENPEDDLLTQSWSLSDSANTMLIGFKGKWYKSIDFNLKPGANFSMYVYYSDTIALIDAQLDSIKLVNFRGVQDSVYSFSMDRTIDSFGNLSGYELHFAKKIGMVNSPYEHPVPLEYPVPFLHNYLFISEYVPMHSLRCCYDPATTTTYTAPEWAKTGLSCNHTRAGIDETKNANSRTTLKAYPNPASSTISFDFDGSQKVGAATFTLYNALGAKVYSCANTTWPMVLDLESMGIANGFYSAVVAPKGNVPLVTSFTVTR